MGKPFIDILSLRVHHSIYNMILQYTVISNRFSTPQTIFDCAGNHVFVSDSESELQQPSLQPFINQFEGQQEVESVESD